MDVRFLRHKLCLNRHGLRNPVPSKAEYYLLQGKSHTMWQNLRKQNKLGFHRGDSEAGQTCISAPRRAGLSSVWQCRRSRGEFWTFEKIWAVIKSTSFPGIMLFFRSTMSDLILHNLQEPGFKGTDLPAAQFCLPLKRYGTSVRPVHTLLSRPHLPSKIKANSPNKPKKMLWRKELDNTSFLSTTGKCCL